MVCGCVVCGWVGCGQHVWGVCGVCGCVGGSLVAQMVKNPPAMQETRVQSLGQEDILEKGKATHSSILAWRIPWPEEPGRLQTMGLKNLDVTG